MRWRWRILIALAVLPLVAAVALVVAIDSALVRAWLATTLADAVSTPGEMEIVIDDLGPGLPGQLHIAAVTIADREGVWLRLEDLVLDWNPWALIGGTIEVADLSVASINLLREPLPSLTPDTTANADDAAFALPQAPGIAIDVARLDVPSITIDASVMGTAATYALTGNADLDAGGAGRLALDLERLDGARGAFVLRFDVDLASNDLMIDAEFNEGRDGLLVHLLDIAPYPALSATLQARGSTSDWDGSFSLVLDETADADATFRIEQDADGLAVVASGTAHPGGLLDTQTAELIGDAVTWNADVRLQEDRLFITAASVTIAPATLETSGTVDLDTMALDLALDARGSQTPAIAELAAPLRFSGWVLGGQVTGTTEAPALTATLTLEQPSAEGMGAQQARVDVSAATVLPDGDWTVDATLALTRPDVGEALANAQLGEAPELHLRGTIGAAFETIDLALLDLTLAAGNLTTALALDTRDGTVAIKGLRGDVPLAPLSELAGLDLTGQLVVAGDVTVTAWGESADGSLQLDTTGLTTGQEALDAILGEAPGITLDISGGPDRVIVSAATVALPIWDAKGNFDIDVAAGTIKGRLSGPFRTTPALAAQVDPALAMTGTLGVVAGGTFDAPIMDVRLEVAKGAYDSLALDGAVVDLREIDISDGLTMALRASVPAGESELAAQTTLVMDPGFTSLAVNDLQLAGPGMAAGGSLTLDLATILMNGRVAGKLTSLTKLADALELGTFTGTGVFETTLTAQEGGRQSIEAKTWIEGLVADGVGISELALAATVSDALGTPELDVRGSFAGIDLAGMTTAEKALLRARGGLDALEVTLEARGTDGPGWTFDTSARVSLGDAGTTVTLAKLELVTGEHNIATSQVHNVTIDQNGITTDKLVVSIDGGTLSFNVSQGDEHLKGALKIEGVPLSVIEIIDPSMVMAGQIDGSADFAFDSTSGEATALFVGSGLKLPDAAGDEEAKLTLDATWRAERLALTLDVAGIEGLSADLKAEWPLTFDPRSGAIDVPLQQQVSANLDLKGNISKLWQHLPISDQLLSGDIDMALSVSGVAADPVVAGTVRLDNGRYENLEWGTIVDDIVIEASSTQDGALQLSINANDGGSGKITMNGRADVSQHGRLLLDAKLTLDDAQLVRRDDAKVIARGDLTFKGTLAGGDITGRFQTVEVDLNVAQSLPSSVTVLNAQDVFYGDDHEHSAGPIKPWQAKLDIEIDMPNKVRVHGRGLDSEWAGKITVAGTLDKPLVSAKLNLVRGNLDVIGRRFTLTTGEVSLVPADEGDPRFDVVAAIDSGDVSGQLEVSGRLSAPELKVTTVPSLPEDEALARLMFGKGAGNLSGLEALQLAGAISEITGTTGGGSGILDRFRDGLGVDVLEVGTDENGNMTVGAGRYLSDGIYVGVQQGASATSSGVVVNIELTDNISLETEAGADASGRVGVDWSWDY